jgi:UDP-glucose 4-epimerase
MKICITGANGFVGNGLCDRLEREQHRVARIVRRSQSPTDLAIGDIGPATEWSAALQACDVVVHLAARVHVMRDAASDPLQDYRQVNVAGTLSLARQAATAGVRRLVYISSVKVNGESTAPGAPFTAADTPAPVDAYGISKMETEEGLREIAANSGMEVVIVRPPLVYGPGVRANFLTLMRWLSRGIPLPLGSIHNQRSLVALDNLVDLIVTCIHHPAAANRTFLVSDGEDLSTTELAGRLAAALDRPARLIPFAPWMLTAGAALLGKDEFAQRLCGNLQVDISKTRQALDWSPPVSVDAGLRATAAHYCGLRGRR